MVKKHPNLERALKSQRKPSVLESTIHTQIAQYLNLVIKRPSRWMTVEVSNQAQGKAAMIRQMQLKKRGVVTGTPDIFIWWVNEDSDGWGRPELKMVFLEVKVPGGKLTEKQEDLHKELKEDGHYVFTVHSVNAVETILTDLGII